MNIKLNHIFLTTHGDTDILDITPQVEDFVRSSKILNGLVTVFSPSSTSGVTTIEFESGVIQDLKKTFNDLVPIDLNYQHDEAWHDGNGYSHVRAALLKTSLVVPLVDSRLMLGPWQQIVYIDFDNRPRKREIIVQIIGE